MGGGAGVNENDTTATDEITFGDNDFLAAQVAILLDARLLVLLTDVDGLHTADPRARPGGRADRRGDATSPSSTALEIGDRTSAFGSGGMRSKVAAAEMASEAGIPAVICNGTSAGTLAAAAAGEAVGTRFAAQAGKASSFKLWLKYAKPAQRPDRRRRRRGPGPARARLEPAAGRDRRRRGRASTPATRSRWSPTASVIGKGIADYSARELARVKGLKSAEVRELLPHAADEVDPPRPLRARLSCVGSPATLVAHGRDHRRTVAETCAAAEAQAARALAERLDRGEERRARGDRPACSTSGRPRSSRRTPPTSPTSGRLG